MIIYYLLLFLTPFSDYSRLPMIAPGLTLIKGIGLLVVFAGIFRLSWLKQPLSLFAWGETRLLFPFFMLVVVSAGAQSFSYGSLFPLFTYVSLIIYLFVSLVYLDSFQKLRTSCIVLLISMFVASLYVYNEYFRWHNPRPGGVVGDPNYYALIAISMLPLSFEFARSSKGLQSLFLWLTTASLVFSTLLTGSRGGLLGLGICFLYATWRMQNRLVIIAGGMLFIPVLFLLPHSPLERILNPDSGSIRSSEFRVELLNSGLNMIKEHPVFGVGVGKFKQVARIYNPSLRRAFIAHNTYINVAAELGIPALLAFMAILFLAWRRARRMAKICAERKIETGYRLAIAIEAGVVGFSVSAFFLTADNVKHIWILIFFGLALNRLVRIQQAAETQPAAGVQTGRLPAYAGPRLLRS